MGHTLHGRPSPLWKAARERPASQSRGLAPPQSAARTNNAPPSRSAVRGGPSGSGGGARGCGRSMCSLQLPPAVRQARRHGPGTAVRAHPEGGGTAGTAGDGRGDPSPSPLCGGAGPMDLREVADKVLSSDESRALLAELAAASDRVAKARSELEAFEAREREVREQQHEVASQAALAEEVAQADAEVARRAAEVAALEEEYLEAGRALIAARAGGGQLPGGGGSDDAAERVESGKAAAVAALAGAAASLPFTLAATGGGLGPGPLASVAAAATTCALFGVTYRYVVRRDSANLQLKGGAVGAFALTRGLAQIDTTQMLVGFPNSGWAEVLKAALDAGESVLVIGLATAALEYCLREGLLQPFPSHGGQHDQ